MKEYQELFETFARLKPGWTPPSKGNRLRGED
jgi:hypothetical protein